VARVVAADVHHLALRGVKGHPPLGRPGHQGVKARLEPLPVRFTADDVRQLGVICELYKECD